METELGPEILHLVEVAIGDIDDDMGESEVSALSDFSDDSDSTIRLTTMMKLTMKLTTSLATMTAT